jgi:hypothetical protein
MKAVSPLLTTKEYDHMVWLITPPLCGKKCAKEEPGEDWSEAAEHLDNHLQDRGLIKSIMCPHTNNGGGHSLPNYKGKRAMDRYLKSRGAE